MPLLRINTNTTPYNKDAVIKQASALVADMLDKSEDYVMIVLDTGMSMSFAGSTAPCALIELKSLGMDELKTSEYSATLCDLVHDLLGVPVDRVHVEFVSPERHMWGWNRTTF